MHTHAMHSRNCYKFNKTRAQIAKESVMRKETGEVDTGQTIEGIYISKTVSQVIINQSS